MCSGFALPYRTRRDLSVNLTMAALYETVTRYHMPYMYRITTSLSGAVSLNNYFLDQARLE